MATINLRVDDELKDESKEILDSLGLDLTSGIKIFLKQVVINKGIPFEVKLAPPDIETALDDIKNGRVASFDSVESLIDNLNDGD